MANRTTASSRLPGEVNWRDFDFRSPMGRRLGALAKWRRFHQFQYFGLVSDELIGGCALADISLLTAGFVYLFHPASGRMIEREFKRPLGHATRFSQQPNDGLCELRSGANLLRLDNRGSDKHLLVEWMTARASRRVSANSSSSPCASARQRRSTAGSMRRKWPACAVAAA